MEGGGGENKASSPVIPGWAILVQIQAIWPSISLGREGSIPQFLGATAAPGTSLGKCWGLSHETVGRDALPGPEVAHPGAVWASVPA